MKKSTVLKTLALSFLFVFSLSAANAQKSDKKDKSKSGIQVKETEVEESKEVNYMWVYSVATVTDLGGKFEINFEESKGGTRESKADSRTKMMIQTQEASKKMAGSPDMFSTETDILNFLAEMKYEVISIFPIPGKEGKVMKYYFKSKVEVQN